MKKHHKENEPCLIDFYDSKSKSIVKIPGKVIDTHIAFDAPYRVTVETEDGRIFRECHPDCIHPAQIEGEDQQWSPYSTPDTI